MKKINLIFVFLIMQSCINNSKNDAKLEIKEPVQLKLPTCKEYSFIGIENKENDVIVKMNCYSDYYDPLAEREYFLYISRNLVNYLEKNKVDSIKGVFIYPNQENRIIDFGFASDTIINVIKNRDSITRPIYYKIIDRVINDSSFRLKTLNMSYIYGLITIGESYSLNDNADIFNFYLLINDEIIYTHKTDNLKILYQMLELLKGFEDEEFIKYLINLYPKNLNSLAAGPTTTVKAISIFLS